MGDSSRNFEVGSVLTPDSSCQRRKPLIFQWFGPIADVLPGR